MGSYPSAWSSLSRRRPDAVSGGWFSCLFGSGGLPPDTARRLELRLSCSGMFQAKSVKVEEEKMKGGLRPRSESGTKKRSLNEKRDRGGEDVQEEEMREEKKRRERKQLVTGIYIDRPSSARAARGL